MARRGENKKDFSIVLILSEKFLISELFKVIQDAIKLILHYMTMSWFQDDFFKYIHHVGCAIKLHSIHSGLTPGNQNLSTRQTVFFLTVNPMDQEHKDPENIDLEAPRLARYMHTAWKKHQNTVYWVDIKLAPKKVVKFYQTRSNAIILHETPPAYCIPKVIRVETGEVIYEEEYASPRPPPKISLRHDWDEKIGFRSCSTSRQLPTNPTKPLSKLKNGEIQCDRTVLKKSMHVSLLTARIQICELNVWRKTKTQT